MTKLCVDCAHYTVHMTQGGIRIRHDCTFEKNTRYSPVTGEVEPKYRIELMRVLHSLCGPEAVYFQPIVKKASKR